MVIRLQLIKSLYIILIMLVLRECLQERITLQDQTSVIVL